METYYTILGVAPDAGQAEIKQKYRFLSQAYHPDKFSSAAHKVDAEAAFKRMGMAYSILSDPVRRAAYDRDLATEAARADEHSRRRQAAQAAADRAADQQRVKPENVASGPPPMPPPAPRTKSKWKRFALFGGAIVLLCVLAVGGLAWRKGEIERLISAGDTYARSGQRADAILFYRRATRLGSNDPDAWRKLGTAYLAVSDHFNAIDAFKRAANLSPASSHRSLLAKAYRRAGLKEEAAGAVQQQIAALKAELQAHPDWGFLWSSLGTAYDSIDRRTDAVESYEQAIRHFKLVTSEKPNDSMQWASLGDAYTKLGNNSEAAAAYASATKTSAKQSALHSIYEGQYWQALTRQSQEAIRLKASAGVESRPAAPHESERPLPSDTSLPNGTILNRFGESGGGTFTMINDSAKDAFVKVVDPDAKRRYSAFYVKASSSYSLSEVPDGNYAVLFTTGFDWDEVYQTFKRSAVYSRFDKMVDFTTTKRREGDYMVTYTAKNTITLKPVRSGNATTSAISAAEFNKN